MMQGLAREPTRMAPDRPVRSSVLIVEDDRIVAMDIQQTLRNLGYDAFAIASSAEEAVRAASARCPDVALMDIRIRGEMDGVSTAGILSEKFGVPVIFLTAHSDDATLERVKQTQPHGYLLKPLKVAELKIAIEVAVYKDAMARKLRERERWFGTTLESIADAVISVDLSGRIAFMNAPAELLTGIKVADALGRSARDVLKLETESPRDANDLHPLDHALRERRPVAPSEATLRRPDQSARLISDSAAPVLDRGNLLGAVMVFRDVTESTRLRQQAELTGRLTALGTMAAGIGHEINNPLAVTVANLDFVKEGLKAIVTELADDGPWASIKRRLAALQEAQDDACVAAERIAKIVGALREFAKPEEHRGEADLARSVQWVLRATAQELRHRALVEVALYPMPPLSIDEAKLGQVLVNLVVNAAQAIAPGNPEGNLVTITARLDRQGQAVISVRDTGSGIAPSVLPRIFDPFFTTKQVGQGTGLGLSIIHGIVVAAGGTLVARSEVGQGTEFLVTLPVAAERRSAAPEIERSTPTAEATKPGRILVVDDEPLVLQVVARVLATQEVVRASSGEEALRVLATGAQFDVIITDLTMGRVGGMQLYEEILRTRPDDARRMLFMTGGALTPELEEFLEIVSNNRIPKPFSPAQLERVVAERVAMARAERAAAGGEADA